MKFRKKCIVIVAKFKEIQTFDENMTDQYHIIRVSFLSNLKGQSSKTKYINVYPQCLHTEGLTTEGLPTCPLENFSSLRDEKKKDFLIC